MRRKRKEEKHFVKCFGKMGDANNMLSVEEAVEIVLRVAQRLPPVTVSLHRALGKILAQDVVAPEPHPPYRASIKVSLSLISGI